VSGFNETSWIDGIELALVKTAEKVKRRHPGHWDFALANGRVLKGTAEISDGWLVMSAPLKKRSKPTVASLDRMWRLLKLNARLAGGAKYALDSEHRLSVRAELPLDDEPRMDRITDACAGFKDASARLRDRKTAAHADNSSWASSADVEGTPCDLQELCREAGWPFVERSGDRLAVALDVPDGFHQAIIEKHKGVVHVGVELGVAAAASSVSRHALSVLLMTANRVVRLCRAAVGQNDGQPSTRFEVAWPCCPPAVELAHALAALSMACRLCAREAEALQDEVIAREYLSVRCEGGPCYRSETIQS
jgi:hypothetical protein